MKLYIFFLFFSMSYALYNTSWDSLDSRPLPLWYDNVKFGIFLHWGVFSVPSFKSAWFWYYWKTGMSDYVDFMKKNYPPGFTYADFAPKFTAEFFNPDDWAELFEASGAKYVVLTSKHHEGFTNWPSKVSFNWNSMDVGPHRDLVAELATAIRKNGKLHFGLYHSLFEWFNPLYVQDSENKFKTTEFVDRKTMPELYELVNRYKPEVVWSDGSMAPDWYWKSRDFLAWLYNESPVKETVVTNDRWGNNSILCKHGGYYTCRDRYNPGTLLKHKWENCMTLDRNAWVYNRFSNLSDYLTIEEVIKELVTTVSCGGNLLLNTGPTHDGRIAPIMEERLRQMGAWLKVNGEAVYGSRPWRHQQDSLTASVWYTASGRGDVVYGFLLSWPLDWRLELGSVLFSSSLQARLLGSNHTLSVSRLQAGGTGVKLPLLSPGQMPCEWAWVVALHGGM